jgi:hypothetical protein
MKRKLGIDALKGAMAACQRKEKASEIEADVEVVVINKAGTT